MPKETFCGKFCRFTALYILVPLCIPIYCIVAPFTRLYDDWLFHWFQQRWVSTPAAYRRKVARVQDQVRAWNAGGRKARMITGKPPWHSVSIPGFNKRQFSQIQIDDLNCVVEIDTARRVVVVEPGVMMGQLTAILIPMGWTIPEVPEFEFLSTGGLICGTGIESSSNRYGFFGDTPIAYEVVTGDGNVVTCSKDENSDLFYSIPWSHGTLGFLMSATIPLLPAKKYVQLEYHPTGSLEVAQRLLESQDHEFVEGIAFGRNKFVVTLGNFSDRPNPRRGPVNHINRWYKQFYYKHVESFLGKRPRRDGKVHVEYYPLRDYYHRHSRGYFWTTPVVLRFMKSKISRFRFGWSVPFSFKLFSRVLYALGIQGNYANILASNIVLQDFVVPMKHLATSIDFFHDIVEMYPLWLCPCKFFKKPAITHCSNSAEASTEMYIDIGVYGEVVSHKKPEYDVIASTQAMEAFTLDHNGVQFLYTVSILSREDFRRMFDLSHYDKVRAKYGALDAFPDVYDKVSKYARGLVRGNTVDKV